MKIFERWTFLNVLFLFIFLQEFAYYGSLEQKNDAADKLYENYDEEKPDEINEDDQVDAMNKKK